MKVGDKVVYSRKFMHNVGMFTGDDPLMFRSRGGVLIALDTLNGGAVVATVRDADGDERRVLVSNLVRISAPEAL